MADRKRNVDPNRTPESSPRDVRDLLRHEIGIGDFAPQMAGLSTPLGVSAIVTGNVLLNGGFEADTSSPPFGWTKDNSATFAATLGTVTTDLTEGQNYGKWTMPSSSVSGPWTLTSLPAQLNATDTPYVKCSVDWRFQTKSTGSTGTQFWLEVQFYDINSALISSVTNAAVIVANSGTTFRTSKFTCPTPAGTESVVMVLHADEGPGGFITAGNMVHYIDNAYIIEANFFEGFFEGVAATQSPSADPTNQLATVGYVDQAIPPGSIVMTGRGGTGGASIPPTGWLNCHGQAVSRSTYADLYAAIGVAFGAGDGLTTFNVPDMQLNMPMGEDATHAPGTTGGTTGSHTHALTGGVATGFAKGGLGGTGQFRVARISTGAWTPTHIVNGTGFTSDGTSQSIGIDLGGITDATAPGRPPWVAFGFIIKY